MNEEEEKIYKNDLQELKNNHLSLNKRTNYLPTVLNMFANTLMIWNTENICQRFRMNICLDYAGRND
jgi:NH3-dependent NAD+ synthetase